MVALVGLLAPSAARAVGPAEALAELAGATGPQRFSVVRDGLYRGGQPTAHHLALLRAVGVDTVVNLRLDDRRARVEATEAARLGMRVVSVPFSGLFRVDARFLSRALDVIRSGRRVYVHCNLGRDRTSLVIAMERVIVEGWSAAAAWEHDAVAFGYRRALFHRNIADSFDAAVRALDRGR
jgi:protein tyrosine/serine phosphatase